MTYEPTLILGDCEKIPLDDNSVDLCFCSPPYEARRTYGIGFNLKGQDWVDWAVKRYVEQMRVCKGVVCWVIEGQTKQYKWSATPALLMADLHRAGVHLRKPPIYKRCSIPGSGGPDWLRNDYEIIVCGQKDRGRLPWSDNTAMGHTPKYGPGGAMSNRLEDGRRAGSATMRPPNGTSGGDLAPGRRTPLPKVANPGNIIECKVGGGLIGSRIAHENEAPFPERLAEFFIRSFCPPDGTVLDAFSGSGTTCAVAMKTGRKSIGMDIRESQIDIARRRFNEVRA